MDDTTIAKYRSLIGQAVEYTRSKYFGLSSTKGWGILTNILLDDQSKRLYAEIRRVENSSFSKSTSSGGKLDKVPVDNVILNTDYTPVANVFKSEAASSSQVKANISRVQDFSENQGNVVVYNGEKYAVAKGKTIKIGVEVVWLLESPSPLVGKVTFVGMRSLETGGNEIVAVVQFNQSTSNLPRHIAQLPLNRNVVDIDDLLSMSVWLQTTTQNVKPLLYESESSDDDHGDSSDPTKPNPTSLRQTSDDEDFVKPGDLIESSIQKNSHQRENFSQTFKGNSEISPEDFYVTVSRSPNSKGKFGIQGYSNSSYMDATIFSLFAFNNSLDSLIHRKKKQEAMTGSKNKQATDVKSVLRSKILNPLQCEYFVSRKNMRKLRHMLMSHLGPQYENSYIDVEEFIIAFFTLINSPELFSYNHGGRDYVHQILLPITWEESQKVPYLTLQHLLENSFAASEVKLTELPRFAFIVKLPVSNGQLIPCDGVIPNLTLDLSTVIDKNEEIDDLHVLHLHAVICLRSNHFVSFVCMDHSNENSRWVFMDSKPTSSIPEVYFLENVSKFIKHESFADIDTEFISTHEPKCNGTHLFRDAFVCIYVP